MANVGSYNTRRGVGRLLASVISLFVPLWFTEELELEVLLDEDTENEEFSHADIKIRPVMAMMSLSGRGAVSFFERREIIAQGARPRGGVWRGPERGGLAWGESALCL